MARGTTVRFALTILSAVLLALQLLTPTAPFASTHSATHVSTPKATGNVLAKRADEADEVVTSGHLGHSAAPTAPLRTRDRHRTAADSAPEPPTRVLPAYADTPPAPPRAGVTAHHLSRSTTAHSAAALQVFRC
ncbi:hypothetical protein [Streptomyces sp. NPDC005485]|uniref:hypothetical protein n=1 Tax=Streptomyces sp. NPDC005485 TaxID=3155591 RepID=UPI0033AE57FE